MAMTCLNYNSKVSIENIKQTLDRLPYEDWGISIFGAVEYPKFEDLYMTIKKPAKNCPYFTAYIKDDCLYETLEKLLHYRIEDYFRLRPIFKNEKVCCHPMFASCFELEQMNKSQKIDKNL
jgi:hypothetical protein